MHLWRYCRLQLLYMTVFLFVCVKWTVKCPRLSKRFWRTRLLKFGVGIQDGAKRLENVWYPSARLCRPQTCYSKNSVGEQRRKVCNLHSFRRVRKYRKHSCVICIFSVRFCIQNQGGGLFSRPFCLGVNECMIWDCMSGPVLVLSSNSFFVLLEKLNSSNY